jgi:hypothetical protein
MPKGRKEEEGALGDDLVTIIQIALLFFALLAGREIGNIYSAYGEVSRLSIACAVDEQALADFLMKARAGGDVELPVGIMLTSPSFSSTQGPVTQTPEYVRRWLISVALSPVVVQQPDVSTVEAQLRVEGVIVTNQTFPFDREKASYIGLLNRTMALHVDDKGRFFEMVQEASEKYGGEVELRLTGRVLAHVAFLDVWLPFSTTRYPLVRVPHADYLSSEWTDADGHSISRMRVGEMAYISVRLWNPTRVHSIWDNITATIHNFGSHEPFLIMNKTAAVAASTEATYVFPFIPKDPGVYFYSLEAAGGFRLDSDASQRLDVES